MPCDNFQRRSWRKEMKAGETLSRVPPRVSVSALRKRNVSLASPARVPTRNLAVTASGDHLSLAPRSSPRNRPVRSAHPCMVEHKSLAVKRCLPLSVMVCMTKKLSPKICGLTRTPLRFPTRSNGMGALEWIF